jgi:carbon starvation protein
VWITLVPMAWLVMVTMTASCQKVFHPNPRIGFLAQVKVLSAQLASGAIPPEQVAATHRIIFNNRLDAAVTLLLAGMILVLVIEAIGEWIAIVRGTKPAVLHEAQYVATKWAEADL